MNSRASSEIGGYLISISTPKFPDSSSKMESFAKQIIIFNTFKTKTNIKLQLIIEQ